MPKPSKTTRKQKAKLKNQQKTEPETPSITTKKSYWVALTLVLTVAASVAGYIMNLAPVNIAILAVTIALTIGFAGYVRVTPSNLPLTRRATFVFVGASVIGFGVWAAIVLVLMATGFLVQIGDMLGDQFFVIPSFIVSLILGAFIGELIGRNPKVQAFFFKPETPV